MYEVLLETTVWPDNTPNHAYVLNDAGKMVAYYPMGDFKNLVEFKKPLPFYKSRRKFKKCKI